MESNWVKAQRIESGNYPKSSFVGVFKAIYPTVKDNGMVVLKVDFEDEKTYDMQAIASSKKAKTPDGIFGVHEDGTYDEFLGAGQWIKSVESLDVVTGLPDSDPNAKHIEVSFAFIDGQFAGIKFEPDIIGRKGYNIATPKTVGDESQTSKYPDWTIGQIDGLSAQPIKKPGKYPAKPKIKEQPVSVQTDITSIVLDALPEPHSISELFTALGKKYKVSELRVALDSLKAQGIVVESAGKYQVM